MTDDKIVRFQSTRLSMRLIDFLQHFLGQAFDRTLRFISFTLSHIFYVISFIVVFVSFSFQFQIEIVLNRRINRTYVFIQFFFFSFIPLLSGCFTWHMYVENWKWIKRSHIFLVSVNGKYFFEFRSMNKNTHKLMIVRARISHIWRTVHCQTIFNE